jgi:hypothetical protein
MTSYDTYYDVYTYLNRLIYFKVDNYENWKHRELVLRRDPNFRIYITKLDEEIFAELPLFEPDILGASPGDPEGGELDGAALARAPFDQRYNTIKREWHRENWSDLLIKLFDSARIHRYCLVKLYEEYPYWRVFTPREIFQIDWDDSGKPVRAVVQWYKHLPRATNVVLQFEDVVEFGEDKPSLLVLYGKPEGRYIASDDIEHLWDLGVALRYVEADIIRNSARSSGFYYIKLGRQASEADKHEIEDALSKANYGNALGAKVTKIEDIVDIHPENAQFSVQAYDKLMKKFAGACRLPLSFFNSETEKGGIGVESKEEEDILVNKKKRFIFGQFRSYILKLVEKRWGVVCDDVFPNIEEYEAETYKEEVAERGVAQENKK